MSIDPTTAQRALRMRTAGIHYEKIADELDLEVDQARQAVADALEAAENEPATVANRIELERLDAMLVGLWKNVTRGDVQAIEQAMRISERRAELLANNTPGGTGVADTLDGIKARAMQQRPDADIYPIDGSGQ